MDIESKRVIFYFGCFGLLFVLAFIVMLYRHALYGRYQLGAHLMASGMLIAIVGAFVAAYVENIPLGARIGMVGFLVGIFGAYKHTANKKTG